MTIRNLMPINRNRKPAAPARQPTDEHPAIWPLHREMDRMFDEFVSRFFGRDSLLTSRNLEDIAFLPQVDVRDGGKEIVVSAEIPGVSEKDIDVRLDGDRLVLKGEKKQESESHEGSWYRSECSYGSFYREVPLPTAVDAGKCTARFQQGVLTVRLPKLKEETGKAQRIHVKTE